MGAELAGSAARVFRVLGALKRTLSGDLVLAEMFALWLASV